MSTARSDDEPVTLAPGDIEEVTPDPDTFRGRFASPEARNYLFAGLAALAMVFIVLFAGGTDLGGLLLVLIGAGGLVLRWASAPALFLVLLVYFLVFPFGLPPADDDNRMIAANRFAVPDLLLAGAVVVYVASHYRLLALTLRAFPPEEKDLRKGAKPPRRPPANVREGEIPRLLVVTVGVVILGQLGWYVVSSAEIDPVAWFPVRLGPAHSYKISRMDTLPDPVGFSRPMVRFLLLIGFGLGFALLARLVLGYWRLTRQTPSEGGLVLQEYGWDQTRRELVRLEKWRLWGRKRAERRADKAAERANRDGKRANARGAKS